jgi:hypothetical protein
MVFSKIHRLTPFLTPFPGNSLAGIDTGFFN